MSPIYSSQFRAMGCTFEVQLETEHDGKSILAAVPAKVEALESCLSRFRPESELSRLNQRSGEWVTVSQELLDNLVAAKHAARLTDGAFNPLILSALSACGYDRTFEAISKPWVERSASIANWRDIRFRLPDRQVMLPPGGMVDLGGIAKGWTVQQIAHELSVYGSALVNGGGDISVFGAPTGRSGWQVDVAHPDSDQALCSLSIAVGSVVTSAIDFRRWESAQGKAYHHIIDPRTGQPAQTNVISATVVHPDCTIAEALAKSILVQGSDKGLALLDRYPETAALVIGNNGSVLATSTLMPYLISPVS